MRQLIALTPPAVLTLVAFAGANTKTVQDENLVGRFATDLDIKSATMGHAGKRRLAHKVQMYDPIPSSFSGNVCITIQSARSQPVRPAQAGSGYSICIQDRKQTRVPVIKMDTGKVKGHARVRYPNAEAVRFVFTKRSIGRPRKYFWRADTAFETSKRSGPCPNERRGYSCFDSAPEIGSEAKHRL